MKSQYLLYILIALFSLLSCTDSSQTGPPPPNNSEATPTSVEQVVSFKDANLEEAVRTQLKRSKVWHETGSQEIIYPSVLEKLWTLRAKDVKDLSGLEYCVNLKTLYLSSVTADLSPLTNLSNLNLLILGDSIINDLRPLQNLSNLTELSITSSHISDISALASLPNLKTLALDDNKISDISPLSNLRNLYSLSLSMNSITNVSQLNNLTHLWGINLSNNQIKDISSLAALTNLRLVTLQSNQISDIEPLVSNKGLAGEGQVILVNNPLNDKSVAVYIPQLIARGVDVRLTFSP